MCRYGGVSDTAYHWDFFGTFLEEARKRQMVVHPWFCVFTEGGILGPVREHPDWLIRSRKGELVGVVNPALHFTSLGEVLLALFPVLLHSNVISR